MHEPGDQPPLIDALAVMCDDLGERWRRVHRDELAFPDLAIDALARHVPDLELDLDALVGWALARPRLPVQGSGDNFAEPSLTIMVGDTFKVDLLFWLDGTTTIHQHMFSGAFRVLAGSSVHAEYHFTPRWRINSGLRLGELALTTAELLRVGDTRIIRPGSALIHSLFHLDRPSVTLVVRTRGEDDVRPQFDYLRPGIAIDAGRAHPDLRKKLHLLRMLQRIGHVGFEERVHAFLAHADLETRFRVLLDRQLVAAPAVRAHLATGDCYPEARPWLVPACDEVVRVSRLIDWRRLLVDPDHRFLLALLMNLSSRRDLLRLVEARHGDEPAGRVLRWIDEIAAIQAACVETPPLFDVDVTGAAAAALHAVVAGGDATGALRSSRILRPLLTP